MSVAYWFRRSVRVGVAAAALAGAAGVARASLPKWTEPTAEELAMKSEPKAPGAPAVVLSFEETDEGESGEITAHGRIKILTEGGIQVGNFEMEKYFPGHYLESFTARVIHPDGQVFPYQPESSNTTTVGERKVVGLSQVQVGSIVEYVLHYSGHGALYALLTRFYAPEWLLQQKYFIRSEHVTLNVPANLNLETTSWVANLPPGMELKRTGNHVDAVLTDVPAAPDEAFMPPVSATLYNVRFFYYGDSKDKFWGESGQRVDYWWSEYDTPTKKLTAAVQAMIKPGEDDMTKLRTLYAAVQQMENTDLTRLHTEKEDKKAGLREQRNSEDIWNNKRGNFETLTLLFVAMAKAAGYQAYPMAVSSREDALFDQRVLSWEQLDSLVAIVVVGGREMFLDPGTKMCPFGRMAPWHSNVAGVSTEAKLVKIRKTPVESSKFSRRDRSADVTLAADGGVTGTIKVTWTGTAGMELRRDAVRLDLAAINQNVERDMKALMPGGVEVKLDGLAGLSDAEVPLVATFTVSGRLGQGTKRRLVLPAQFFAGTEKALFVSQTRTQPIAFPNASSAHDEMKLHLPQGFAIETLPDEREANSFGDSHYAASVVTSDGDSVITTERLLVVNRVDYPSSEYANLHRYFSQVAEYDQDQIVVNPPRAAAGAAGTF